MSIIFTPSVSAANGSHRVNIRAGLFEVVKRALLWPSHVAQARSELAKLAHFSEYELRDIGLTSQDLRNASALPLDIDPTSFLAKAAENGRGLAQ